MSRFSSVESAVTPPRIFRLAAIAAFLLFPALVLAQPGDYIITTYAGNNTAGSTGDGGAPTSAELDGPVAVTLDGSGNIFISDSVYNKVRRISSGLIYTYAGNERGIGSYGGDGGLAIASTCYLNGPFGLAVDAGGNLYIADLLNHVVRVVIGSTIYTFAGNNSWGESGDGGQATSAQLNQPWGVAVDSSGNVYISDSLNNRVRKVDSAGVITTVAGNGFYNLGDGGPAVDAQLNHPYGIAVDSTGVLYIADSAANRIRRVGTDGIITTIAGTGQAGYSGDGGQATSATLNRPSGIAVDTYGNLFIADYNNNCIRVVTPDGKIKTIAGGTGVGYTGDTYIATNARFNFPVSVAVDSSTGKVYVADVGNNVIRLLTPYAPSISTGGVITAASWGGFSSVAPGSWIEIYGANLAQNARSWKTADFSGSTAPTALDGTSLTIGGKPAYISYISNSQINAQVPSTVSAGQQKVVVTTAAGSSSSYTVTVNATQPGLLAPASFNHYNYQFAVAVLSDGATYAAPSGLISGVSARPAKAGETITFYGTGFGSVTPDTSAGQIAKQTSTLVNPVQFIIGGTQATVSYQGLAPGSVGLYQFNVVVPAIAANDLTTVKFVQNGTAGSQTLYIAVQ